MKQFYLLFTAFIFSAVVAAQCNYQLVLQDNFGSGFTAPAGVNVSINGTSTFYTVVGAATAPNIETYTIPITTGDVLIFDYTAPTFTGDLQWSLIDSEGFVLFDSGFNPNSAADFSGTGSCPTCPAVTNPVASNVTANSAEIAWTRVGTETEWVIEYGVAPYTQGSGGVVVNVTTNPSTITGLQANTTYDYCIRSVCGTNDLGRNSCGSFTTTPSCPVPGAFIPVTQTANEVQFTWDANGNGFFDYEIEYAIPGVITAPGTGQGTTVTGNTAPFAQITGLTANTTYQFFVRINCGGGDFSAWTSTPYTATTTQSCPDVSNIRFSNIDQTSVDVAWNNGGTETQWSIEYGVQGFTPGTGTVVSVSTNPFTLTGLSSGTSYDVCVTAVCAANDRSTPVCANVLTPADYCSGDLLVDSGGPAGNYSPNEFVTYTVCPDNPGDVVYVDFTQFDLEANDNCTFDSLTVYAGPDTSSPRINPPTGTGGWCWNAANNTGSGNLVGVQLTGALPSGCLTFVFDTDGSVQRAGFIANVTCAAPPSCPVPTALAVQSVTDTGVTLGWVAGNTETEWAVEYGAPGFAPGTGTVVQALNNPFTVTGLTANTPYEFYLTAVCGAGDVSTQIGPIPGRTACVSFAVPFFEGFNSTSPTKACWTVRNVNADADAWNLSYAITPFEGNQSASINTDFNGGNDDDYLITPGIILTGNQRLRYHYRAQSANEPNVMEVLLSTTGTAPADFTNVLLPVTQFGNVTYIEQQLDLSAYTGTVYIAWRIPPSNVDGWRVYIDNVRIDDRPSCPDPLQVTSSGATTSSINIAWAAEPLSTTVTVEYGPCGFVPGTSAAGAVSVTATANPFTITGLSPNTCYEAYVSYECSGTNSVRSNVTRFQTLCNAFTVPYTEGFNSTSTTESCWTVLNVNGDADTWDLNYAVNVGEGDQVAAINTDFNGGNDDDYLISPGIIMTGNERLRYIYRVQSAAEPNNMEVLLSTTGVAPADFTTTLLPAALYSNTTYAEQIIDLSAYTGTVYVAWRIPPSTTDGWRMYIDNVRFETIPACDEPIALVSSNPTSSSVDIGFTERGTATSWEIQYGAPGFALGSGTVVTASSNPFTLAGLTADTCYDFFVRSSCPGGGFSPWSARSSFCTACNVFTAPYTTGFENFTATTNLNPVAANGFLREQCWSSDRALFNWVVAPPTLTASGGTGPAPSVNTGNYMFTESSSGATGAVANLRSPLINITGLSTPILEFDYHMFGATTGSLEVFAVVAGVETSLLRLTGQQQTTETAPYIKATIPLSSYIGQTVQFTFRATRGSSFTSDLAIDNFAVIEVPTCAAPSLLNMTAVRANDAVFGWTENGTATVWQVEVQPRGIAQGTTGAVYTNNAASNPQTITGLSSSTAYSAYVRAVCGTTDFSTWVGPFNFATTAACGDTVYDTGGPNGQYANNENYTITYFPDAPGNLVTLNFTSVALENCCDTLSIFDGTDVTAPVLVADLEAPASFRANNPSGALTLRFTSDGSVVRDGWVALYTCSPPPACSDPSALTATAITATTANLEWTQIGSSTAWEYEYDVAGFTRGTGANGIISTSSNSVNAITGLTPITSYDYYVRAVCPTSGFSTWVGPFNFTTACAVFPTPYGSVGGAPGNNFNVFPGPCWSEGLNTPIAAGPNGGNGAWGSLNFGNLPGGGANGLAARINIWDSFASINDWLVSPEFDLGGPGHNMILNYLVALTNWNATTASVLGSDDQVQLLISTDNGVTWNNLLTYNASTPIPPTGRAESVSLAAYSGVVKFAFWASHGTVSDIEDVDFFVDNFTIDATAGINTPGVLNFNYFPNPTTGILNVVGNEVIDRVVVRNLLGQLIFESSRAAVEVQVDITEYPTGVYLVEVRSGNVSNTVKIIKE